MWEESHDYVGSDCDYGSDGVIEYCHGNEAYDCNSHYTDIIGSNPLLMSLPM